MVRSSTDPGGGLEMHTASGRQRRGGGAGHAQIPPPHRPKRQRRQRDRKVWAFFFFTQ